AGTAPGRDGTPDVLGCRAAALVRTAQLARMTRNLVSSRSRSSMISSRWATFMRSVSVVVTSSMNARWRSFSSTSTLCSLISGSWIRFGATGAGGATDTGAATGAGTGGWAAAGAGAGAGAADHATTATGAG